MSTRWFLCLIVAALGVAGVVVARGPRPADGPPAPGAASPAEAPTFMPAGTPASGRFRFVDLTGQPAPEFTLTDLEGWSHRLSQYRGRVVMLIFWATWCKTCPTELPKLGEIARSLATRGLVTLAVNWEKEKAPVARMARDTHLGVPVLRDPDQKTRYDYDAFAVPRVIIIDRAGKIARVVRGYEGTATPVVNALRDQGLSSSHPLAIPKPVPVERVPLSAAR